MITVDNLSMSYGSKLILDNVSFLVKDNAITGFLGANGAGKSTTMNLLTGYLVPKSGDILINDVDITKDPINAKKQFGYLPEIPPVYKEMRIEEYLRYIADIKKVSDKKSEIDRVLELFDLDDKRYDFIKKLSKGNCQRVAFAGALVGDPNVLILDEPLVGLDPVESKKIREILKSLKDDHCIFISSHILSEIEELCTDIIMIKDGKVVINDSTKTIKHNNKNNQYTLKVKGEKEKIQELLIAYSSVNNVKYIGENEPGVFDFIIDTKNNRDIRDSLLGYLVGKKCNVYSISRAEASLEEVFLNANEKEEV